MDLWRNDIICYAEVHMDSKDNYTKLWFIVYHNVQNSVIEIQSEIKKEE